MKAANVHKIRIHTENDLSICRDAARSVSTRAIYLLFHVHNLYRKNMVILLKYANFALSNLKL